MKDEEGNSWELALARQRAELVGTQERLSLQHKYI
jgi:hypothetical protein